MQLDEFLKLRGIAHSQLLAAVPVIGGENTFICGGSLAEGFGNIYSDLDLYILHNSPSSQLVDKHHLYTSLDGSGLRVVRDINGCRVDIKPVPVSELESISHALFISFKSTRSAQIIYLPIETLVLAHRVCNGITLGHIGCPHPFHSILISLEANLREFIIHTKLTEAKSWLSLSEKLSNNSSDLATEADRNAFLSAVDALLAVRGFTNPRFDKWRVRKALMSGIATHFTEELIRGEPNRKLRTLAREVIDEIG